MLWDISYHGSIRTIRRRALFFDAKKDERTSEVVDPIVDGVLAAPGRNASTMSWGRRGLGD